MLLAAGANVQATTRLGDYTPLLLASQGGHARGRSTRSSRPAPTRRRRRPAGVTPLMLAAPSGQADAVKALLARGADVNATEPTRGETALMFAAANSRVDVDQRADRGGRERRRRNEGRRSRSGADESRRGSVPARRSGQRRRGPRGNAARRRRLSLQARRGGREHRPATDGGPAAAARRTPAAAAIRQGPRAAVAARGRARCARPASPASRVSSRYRGARQRAGRADAAALRRRARVTPKRRRLLLDAGADINSVTGGDRTSPLLMAVINGHFDLAKALLDRGANPTLASDNGVTPLYAALNVQWAPQGALSAAARLPAAEADVPRSDEALLDKGVDVNARLTKKVWYSGYNFALSGVDEIGATPFWRAAYAERRRRDAAARRARRRPEHPDDQAGRTAAHRRRRRPRNDRGRLRPAAGADRRPRRAAAAGRRRRRLRRGLRRATRTATRRAAGCRRSSTSSKSCGADVNAPRPRGQHRAAPRRRARRQRDDPLPRRRRAPTSRRSTAPARPPPTWPTAPFSASSRSRRRSRCSRSSARRTTTSAKPVNQNAVVLRPSPWSFVLRMFRIARAGLRWREGATRVDGSGPRNRAAASALPPRA